MPKNFAAAPLLVVLALALVPGSAAANRRREPTYTIAFASFAPLDTDVFVADGDGGNAKPLLAHPDLDYDASISSDGRWVVFTSERGGSADIYRVRPDGSNFTRLTDDPAFDDQAALSPDGSALAFVSDRSGQADVWILTLATRRLVDLTSHPAGDFRPSWSPDGQWIAFSSDRDSTKPKGNGGFEIAHSTDLYVVRRDGTGVRRVTRGNACAGSPTWSPDGKRLLYYEATQKEVNNITSVRRLRGVTQIAAVDVETGEARALTEGAGEKWSPRWAGRDRVAYASGGPDAGLEFVGGAPGPRGEFGSPSWSADGRRMVFHRDVGSGWPPYRVWHTADERIRLVRTGIFPSFSRDSGRMICNDQTAGALHNSVLELSADGSKRSVLFTDPAKSALAPVWSPSGDRIAFALGSFFQTILGPAAADIAIVRADGTGLRLLTDGTGNYGFPSWSPDGRRIVCRASTTGDHGLIVIDVETGAKTPLRPGSAKDNFPAWSPAGDRIAFTSYVDGNYDIYTIRPDGSGLERLTTTPGNDAHCSWSPDGEWIAFASGRGEFRDEAALHPYNPQPYGDIWVMRADGSDLRRLTDNQYEEATPAWMPLGRSESRR